MLFHGMEQHLSCFAQWIESENSGVKSGVRKFVLILGVPQV